MQRVTPRQDHFGYYVFKIILIGDGSVGKTSLVNRYVFNRFPRDYKASIGSNIMAKDMKVDEDTSVKLSIWDIAGQQQWEVMRPIYYQGAHGIILVYDVTNKKSYDHLFTNWHNEMQTIQDDYKVLILGNKIDETDLKFEDEDKLRAKFKPIDIIKTSALSGDNVEKAFKTLTEALLEVRIDLKTSKKI